MFWNHDGWGFFGVLSTIASWITGFVVFLIWVAILVLLVRFLLIGTRAAKFYLTQHGQDAGLLPRRPAPPRAGRSHDHDGTHGDDDEAQATKPAAETSHPAHPELEPGGS